MDLYIVRNELANGKSIFDISMRVTFYARVSTGADEQSNSLKNQIGYYSELIKCNPKWDYAEGYIDEALSGTSVYKRESFLRMISDAKKGEFDFIITKEISRFSRNTLDSINYTQQLLAAGVGVLFQSDNINTFLPDSELRLTIMSSIAQDEVRKISERVRFGFRRAVEKGVVLGNSNIWGYKKQNGKLVIDEDEAEIIRFIFNAYATQNMGIRTICTKLEERGYKNGRDNPFSYSTVKGIIENPKYMGYYCGNKTHKYDYKLNNRKLLSQSEWVMYKDEDTVPPIISEELWHRANEILKKRSVKRSSPEKTSYQNKYTYSGKIICDIHKKPYHRSMFRYKSGNKEVWLCGEYGAKGKAGCTAPPVYTAWLDDIIKSYCKSILEIADIKKELVEVYTKASAKYRLGGEINKIKAQISYIEKKKDKLLDLCAEGILGDNEFRERLLRLNNETALFTQKKEHLEAERVKTNNLIQRLDMLEEGISEELNFTNGFSNEIVDALIEKIYISAVDEDKSFYIKLCLRTGNEITERRIR